MIFAGRGFDGVARLGWPFYDGLEQLSSALNCAENISLIVKNWRMKRTRLIGWDSLRFMGIGGASRRYLRSRA
jgi:hypothetical protein